MSQRVTMNADQIARGEYRAYDPERFDFRWNHNHTEVEIIPLRWWDDRSYAAYQADCGDDRPTAEDMAACEFEPALAAHAACDWPLPSDEVPF